MFTTRCFIRKNSEELQEKLVKIGYEICPCCNFEGAVWLNNYIRSSSVHGIGYVSEDSPFPTTEGMLEMFLEENDDPKYSHCHSIDCGTNEELFLALASMRDDSDINQWFRYKDSDLYICCVAEEFTNDALEQNTGKPTDYHKVSAEELIKFFKNE